MSNAFADHVDLSILDTGMEELQPMHEILKDVVA